MVDRTPSLALAKPDFDTRQWQDLINDNFTVLDALWAKFFATTGLAGVWQNATAYTVGTLVVDEVLGSIWLCAVAHTSPSSGTFLASRTSSPTYWSNYTIGVRYKGAWSSAATYAVGDFVVANSSFFAVANIAHTAGSAFATTGGVWEVLIDTSSAVSAINASVSSAGTYATAAGVSASAAGTFATAAGTFATAAGTYATAAALSAAMAAAGVVWCGTGSGADDIVLTAASFTLVDGATVEWRQVSDNTTTVRLNPNSVGLTALVDSTNTAVSEAGILKADRIYRAKYSTTTSKFEFLGPTGISVGKHVFPVHANAMILSSASAPSAFTAAAVTNVGMIQGISFNSTGLQYAEFELPMPKSLATAGTITYRARWTATAGTSAQTCLWQMAGVGFGDGDTLDAAQGTAVDTTDLLLPGTLIEHVGPESSAVTIASFASEDTVRFRINRKITGNTLLTPAILRMVEVFLTIAKRNDT